MIEKEPDGFTQRNDDDLAEFFAGRLVRGTALKSNFGNSLEHFAATSVSEFSSPSVNEHGFALETIRCVGSSSGSSEESTEMSDALLYAVQRENKIRRTLSLMRPEDVKVLEADYTPIPPFVAANLSIFRELRGVVQHQIGYSAALILAGRAAGPTRADADKATRDALRVDREAAKREISSALGSARTALYRAKVAYGEAARSEAKAAREERAARFARFLSGAA